MWACGHFARKILAEPPAVLAEILGGSWILASWVTCTLSRVVTKENR